MTYEFTPGPWHSFRQGTKRFVSQRCDEEFKFAFAVVFEQNYHPSGIISAVKEADANARLIAAAPDMLAALETLQSVMSRLGFDTEDCDISGGDTVEAMAEAWPHIVAAIAKARGT